MILRRCQFQRQNSLTDLHEAILENSLSQTEEAIRSNIPIDFVDHRGQTSLFYACERGFFSLVRLLLDHQAQPNLVDHHQISPLSIATRRGHDEIVLLLLQSGASVNQCANDQTTPLYHASYEGHWKCVYHLLRFHANVHLRKNSGASPLFVAARNGHHRIVKHLLKHGANPFDVQQDFRSPLHTAFLYNRIRCVRLILRQNCQRLIEQKDIYGWTHLHFIGKKGSCQGGHLFFHYFYLTNSYLSFDLHQIDHFGNTALHIAAFYHRTKFVTFLLDRGFVNNQTNHFGWTVEQILQQNKTKVKINQHSSSSCDYLHHLVKEQQLEYSTEENQIRNEVEIYVQSLVNELQRLNPLFENRMICSGSFYEKTRVGLPNEFDFMINLIRFERLCQFIENDNDSAGYCRLIPLETVECHQELEKYLEPITGCLSSSKIREEFYQLLTSARSHVFQSEILSQLKHLKLEWTSGDKRCGTAIHAEWYGQHYGCLMIKIDVVPCLTMFDWPRQAKIPCPLISEEFQLIPRSPNAHQTYLWRISTSRSEMEFLRRIDREKVEVYRCLKCLRQTLNETLEIDRIKYTEEDLITSYMFKTVFLHEFDRFTRRNDWIKGSFLHRIMSILKRLEKSFHRGFLPSYFITNYNVIDSDDYQKLRRFELRYIHRIQNELKDKIEQLDKKYPRRNTFDVFSSNKHRHHITRLRSHTTQI